MSKKAQKRRGSRPVRSDRPASAPTDALPARRAGPGRTPALIGGLAALAALAALVAVWVFVIVPGETRPGGPVPGSSATPIPSPATNGSTGPSGATAPGASAAPGGPVAEALIAKLHADPFVAHVEESTVARTTSGTISVTVTAKAVGDIAGRDVSLHLSGSGAGPAVDQDLVSIGDVVWIRRAGSTTWEVHPRAAAASAIDGLVSTVRLIDDPKQLTDMGIETVDGQQLHHLAAAGSIVYRSADGADGAYDRFEVWAKDDGTPVLAKGAFSAARGTDSIVGNTDVRYGSFGVPVTITPPAGAPTLAPQGS